MSKIQNQGEWRKFYSKQGSVPIIDAQRIGERKKCSIEYFNEFIDEDEHREEIEPLAQITSLFGEHYSESGLKTIQGICSIKEGKIIDIEMNIMRRNLLNGKLIFNKKSLQKGI